jgi:hypothetical protein
MFKVKLFESCFNIHKPAEVKQKRKYIHKTLNLLLSEGHIL